MTNLDIICTHNEEKNYNLSKINVLRTTILAAQILIPILALDNALTPGFAWLILEVLILHYICLLPNLTYYKPLYNKPEIHMAFVS